MKNDKNKASGGFFNYMYSFFKNVQEERERIAQFQQYQDTCQVGIIITTYSKNAIFYCFLAK
jgi:hypothetical protein